MLRNLGFRARIMPKVLMVTGVLVFLGFTPALSGVTLASAAPAPVAHRSGVQLPVGWQHMSVAELATHGIVPNMPGPSGGHATVESRTVAGAITPPPPGHTGCNLNVCIDVEGSGLNVTFWGTDAGLNGACSFAVFNVDGLTEATGPEMCGGGNSGVVTAPPELLGNYLNNTTLCNAWPVISGYPCATVHS